MSTSELSDDGLSARVDESLPDNPPEGLDYAVESPAPMPEVVDFAVYEMATGRVLRSGYVIDEATALLQALPGEAVYLGVVPPQHYVSPDGLIAMGEAPSRDHTFDWSAHAWHDARTIEEIQDRRWSEIKQHRDLLESSGFPFAGKTLDSDTRSVQRINTAVQAAQAALSAGEPFDIVWTCADNTTIALDGVAMLGAPVALAVYADQLHQTAKALRAQIYAANSAEAVAAVEWPVITSEGFL